MSPASDLLSRFEKGELTTEQEREVVRELLQLSALPGTASAAPSRSASESDRLVEAFEHAMNAAEAARERREESSPRAPELLAELSAHPFDRQLTLVRNRRRYATWAFVHHLCQTSLATGGADTQRCEELARLAVAAAEQAAAETLSPRLAHDLEAEAWGQLGNALRLRFDLRAAAAAFTEAARRLAEGTGDPLGEARLLSLRASLAADRGDFSAASALCGRAVWLQRQVGARHPLGRTLVQLAAFAAEAERFAEAFEAASEAARLIDFEREPRLALALHHNKALCLEKLGRLEEAGRELATAQRLAERSARRPDLARVEWVGGRIAAGLGDVVAAERAFRAAITAFCELEAPFDAALVSLELALVLLQEGRSSEVRELASRMVPVFESQEIEVEARAALALFRAAAVRETLERGFLLSLIAYLERAKRQPGLRFHPRG